MVKTCTIEGCDRKFFAKGLCRAHYQRNRRYGDPKAGNTMEGVPDQAIIAAARSSTDECINWPFATSGNGYGMIWRGSRHIPATHAVMEACGVDQPTQDHQIAHEPLVCRNPACINPRHIRWALAAENMADNRGAQHPLAKITEADVLSIRSDKRKQREIADHYGIDQGHVSAIRARKAWGHV